MLFIYTKEDRKQNGQDRLNNANNNKQEKD